MDLKIIPDVVSGQTVRSLLPSDSALEAARMMREHDISAIVVLDESGLLVGIVTERDLARRVAAEDRQASSFRLAEVMSAQPHTIAPGASPYDGLEQMRRQRVRHLPVVEGGRVVGMMSMRDLRHVIGTGKGPRGGLLGRLTRARR